MPNRPSAAIGACVALLVSSPCAAEEGMWTFDSFPIAAANAALGTHVDQPWLDRVRLSSVRIGGASGGLVSAEGLILTNEHVAERCVGDLSTPGRDYGKLGFTPASRGEEQRCPGYSAEILTSVNDVTARVQAAGKGLAGEAVTRARNAESGRIESEACPEGSPNQCQVVSLYRGGQFKLYIYRRYTDIRLAFAPEHRAAAFGGDLDNFSFPRFSIDAAFLRIYEDGRPLATPVHFRWNPAPLPDGAPLFVSGTPGPTLRLLTQAQLRTVAEVTQPLQLQLWSELRGRLIRFGEENADNAFWADSELSGLENGYKRARGRQQALIDARFMAMRAAAEADFRRRVAADPALADAGDPWADLEALQAEERRLYPAYSLLEDDAGGWSQFYWWAATLVRGAAERAKPSAERLPEFGEARLPLYVQYLGAPRPANPALEELKIAWWLAKAREILTVDDPRIRTLLGKESPEQLAHRIVSGSKLGDPAVRLRLWEGGLAEVERSDDPMIRFLLAIDGVTRDARSEYENKVQTPTDRASEALARLRFAVYGTGIYPDGTSTLRLTYGRARGWSHDGRTVPHATTFAGLWDRATGAPPFDLAPRLAAARPNIPDDTILNIAASTDTGAGWSGSPVIDGAGRIVGVNFDTTMLAQRNAFGYDPAVSRSVIVSVTAITAALRHAYGQQHLLAELGVR